MTAPEQTPAARASQILLDLAAGKYSAQITLAEGWLNRIAIAIPPAAPFILIMIHAFDTFLVINKVTVPFQGVEPDGQGGVVPSSNSHFDPATGRFTKGPFSL